MWDIASRRPRLLDAAWMAFALANLGAMVVWPSAETIPFHLIWISLTLLYGFRVWSLRMTSGVLAGVVVGTGVLITEDAAHGIQLWGELFEVPLMSAMFLAMVWHARRRQDALAATERQAAQLSSLLARQERFLHDVSHELRTPVAIARGHLELLRRLDGEAEPEVEVALDELARIEGIVERLLLLAKAEEEGSMTLVELDLEPFLEDVFMRWAEVAPRAWRLGPLAAGTIGVDAEALRIALDALLENAVKYTEAGDLIELSAAQEAGSSIEISVADGGCGIPEDALGRIFDRFARSDSARSREHGGVGLGLAIVDAIAKAHGGRCSVAPSPARTRFTLRLPRFAAAPPSDAPRLQPAAAGAPAPNA
jgi:signal transduction histidine kinase